MIRVNNLDQVGTALRWHRAGVWVPPVPAILGSHCHSSLSQHDHYARVDASEVQEALLLEHLVSLRVGHATATQWRPRPSRVPAPARLHLVQFCSRTSAKPSRPHP